MALSDPDVAGPASQPPLSDLHVLALGFNDLAVKAMTPQPVARSESTTPAPNAPSAGAGRMRMPKVYDSNNADVVAPVTMKQDMPRFSRPVLTERTGVNDGASATAGTLVGCPQPGSNSAPVNSEPAAARTDALRMNYCVLAGTGGICSFGYQ